MFKIGRSEPVCFVKGEQITFATFQNSGYFLLLSLLSEVIKGSSVLLSSKLIEFYWCNILACNNDALCVFVIFNWLSGCCGCS